MSLPGGFWPASSASAWCSSAVATSASPAAPLLNAAVEVSLEASGASVMRRSPPALEEDNGSTGGYPKMDGL